MLSRFGSAILALGATVLLGLAIASAWWSGHPSVNGGAPIKLKTMTVSLFGAEGCNTGGDGKCEPLGLAGSFKAQEYVEAGALGLVAVVALLLAILAVVKSPARRGVAKVTMTLVGVAAIVAVVLLVQGPQVAQKGISVSVPVAAGTLLMFGFGAVFAIMGGIFALQPDAPPRVKMPKQLAPAQVQAQHSAQQQVQQQQPFDVQALLQDDALRPTGPGAAQHAYSSPVPAQSPLFQGAPQLRPLYEAAPNQGGTGGFVPGPTAPLPTRPPTPVPRDAISSMAGIPTPPAIEAQRVAEAYGVSGPYEAQRPAGTFDAQHSGGYGAQPSGGYGAQPSGGFGAQPSGGFGAQPSGGFGAQPSGAFGAQPSGGFAAQPPAPAEQPRGKTLPPPVRGKPMSVPPPLPPRSTGTTAPPPVPMPAGSRMPPVPPRANPTSVSAAVPPPSVPFPTAAPAGKRPRVETDGDDEGVQTIQHEKPLLDRAGPAAREFDASLPSPAADPHAPTAAAEVAREENTDVGQQPLNESTGVSGRFEMPTTESRRFSADDPDPPADPPPPSDPEDIATSSVPKSDPVPPPGEFTPDSGPLTIPARPAEAILALAAIPPPPKPAAKTTGQVPAAAPPRASAQVAAAAPPRPSAQVAAATPPRASAQVAVPAVPAAAPTPPKTGQIQIPISTAPESLPPPTAKQAATAGPSPACPQCEAPMAWVEEHLRFYCKSCKMYF
jgi:hypothetical protein